MSYIMNLVFPHKDFKIYVCDTSSNYIVEPYGNEPIPINNDGTFTVEYGADYSLKTANILIINTRTNKSTVLNFNGDNNKTIYVGFELPFDTIFYYRADNEDFNYFIADKNGNYTAYSKQEFTYASSLSANFEFVDSYFNGRKALKAKSGKDTGIQASFSNKQFITGNAITAEIRFKFDVFVNGRNNVICDTHTSFDNFGEIRLKINNDNRYYLEIGHYGIYNSDPLPVDFNPENWHVIAITGYTNAGQTCVYIDGIKYYDGVLSAGFFNNTAVLIGRYNNLTSSLIIDEYAVFNTIKYSGDSYQVNNDYPLIDPPFIIEPKPVAVVLSSSNSVIVGESVTLDATRSYIEDGEIVGYSWCNGATTPITSEIINTSGYHSCTVTASNNTTSTGYVYIEAKSEPIVDHDPVAIITADKKTILIGETIELSGINSYCINSSIVSYLWSTGETTEAIQITPERTTVYTLTVTAENGRTNTASVTINVETGEIDLMHYLPIYWHPNLEMIQIQKKSLNYLMYNLYSNSNIITTEAYIGTASDMRLSEWEWDLEIEKADDIETRRENILAFFHGKGKLNEEKVKAIVYFYYGVDCDVSIKNSNIDILIYPLSEDTIDFSKVERDLYKKKPAHLGVWVDRYWYSWGEVKNDYSDWNDMKQQRETWGKLKNYLPYLYD